MLLLAANGVVFGTDPVKQNPPVKPTSIPGTLPIVEDPFFAVEYYDSFVNITGSGYTGTVQVYSIGENGFTTTLTMNGGLNAFIDLSILESGNYILQIVTADGVVYEEEFGR